MSAPLPQGLGRLLRKLAQILEADGYSTDADLERELGLDYSDVRTVIGIAYRQRRVDRCGPYLVPPARPDSRERRPA